MLAKIARPIWCVKSRILGVSPAVGRIDMSVRCDMALCDDYEEVALMIDLAKGVRRPEAPSGSIIGLWTTGRKRLLGFRFTR